MYTLYNGAGTGSACVHAALEEIGTSYELLNVDMENGDQQSDWYTKINPRQQIPTFILPDGSVMTESAAILVYLADAHPEAGLMEGTGSSGRAQTLRWITFMTANIYEGCLRQYYADRYTTTESEAGNVSASAVGFLKSNYAILEDAAVGPFFAGNTLTIVDLYIWMLIQWWEEADWMQQNCPKLSAIVEAVAARPKIAPVQQAHFG